MKLTKITLKESIGNMGKESDYNFVDYANMNTYDDFEAVAPVSYASAVEEIKRMRSKANELLVARRKMALKAVEADNEDRFLHMTDKQKRFNKAEEVILDESLEIDSEDAFTSNLENIIKPVSPQDKLLIKLAMVNFEDWKSMVVDLLDNMSEKDIDKFIKDYNYEIKGAEKYFSENLKSDKIEETPKQLKEEILTNLNQFSPWNRAIPTWEKIQSSGKLEEFKYIINSLYPNGIDEQTLNDLLGFEANFIFKELGIGVE